MLLGKSLLITILDLFQINPYSRIGLSEFAVTDDLRRTIAQKIFTDE